MLGAAPDQPGADHHIPLVQDGRLPGCDAVARRLELEAKAAARRLDECRNGLGPVAQLCVGTGDRDIDPPCRLHARPPEGSTRTDDDRVRTRTRTEHVERLRGGESESLPLARREPPMPRVSAEL